MRARLFDFGGYFYQYMGQLKIKKAKNSGIFKKP